MTKDNTKREEKIESYQITGIAHFAHHFDVEIEARSAKEAKEIFVDTYDPIERNAEFTHYKIDKPIITNKLP